MKRKNHRESISIISGWSGTCRVDFNHRAPLPKLFFTKIYYPKTASAARLTQLVNDSMKQSSNRPDVSIIMMGDTLFFDIDV
jgi:hypothetical protein